MRIFSFKIYSLGSYWNWPVLCFKYWHTLPSSQPPGYWEPNGWLFDYKQPNWSKGL